MRVHVKVPGFPGTGASERMIFSVQFDSLAKAKAFASDHEAVVARVKRGLMVSGLDDELPIISAEGRHSVSITTYPSGRWWCRLIQREQRYRLIYQDVIRHLGNHLQVQSIPIQFSYYGGSWGALAELREGVWVYSPLESSATIAVLPSTA